MKWEGNCNSHGFSEAKESIRIYSGLFLYMFAWSTFGVKYKSTCMYHICSFFLYYNWIFKSTVIRKIKCFICISCFFHVFFLFIFFLSKAAFQTFISGFYYKGPLVFNAFNNKCSLWFDIIPHFFFHYAKCFLRLLYIRVHGVHCRVWYFLNFSS